MIAPGSESLASLVRSTPVVVDWERSPTPQVVHAVNEDQLDSISPVPRVSSDTSRDDELFMNVASLTSEERFGLNCLAAVTINTTPKVTEGAPTKLRGAVERVNQSGVSMQATKKGLRLAGRWMLGL